MKPSNTLHNLSLEQVLSGSIPAAGRITLKLMSRLQTGSLRLTLPNGATLNFGQAPVHADHAADEVLAATLKIKNWSVCNDALKSGDVGFAEAYIRGDWTTDSLPDLLKLLIANRDAIETAIYGSKLGQLFYRVKHWLNRNSRAGSKRNIHAHYDLGNQFYRLWLDPSMTYSSALYNGDFSLSLEQAQTAKYQRILSQLSDKTSQQILEIGCGWGGFAELAIQAGHEVTGLTLSTEQLEWAKKRLAPDSTNSARRSAAERLLLQDYRDTNGQFDAIVSIEMFEAVGEQYWGSYFDCLSRNLKSGGLAVVQTIVIADQLFERYRSNTDFIQQYIFPGGMLPSQEKFTQLAITKGFKVKQAFAFGHDYAHTLKLWRIKFMDQLQTVKTQGFDDRFVRTWEFYLAYCEAAFSKGNTDVYQFTLQRD